MTKISKVLNQEEIMIQTNNNSTKPTKNCNFGNNFANFYIQNKQNAKKLSKEQNDKLLKTVYKTDLNIYVKVLLEAYKSLPNIINIIDRIIEKRASTIPASAVYGTSYYATYSEMNKVIDLSSRKDKLLNMFVMIEKMLDSLSEKDRKIAVLKFVQKTTAEDIAKEMNSAERTIYRTFNKIIEKLAIFMLEQNWTSDFIKKQISKNEPWLEELFFRKKSEELNRSKSKK